MVVIKYQSGDVYDGDYEDDTKHGQGTLTYAQGGSYEGEWEDDMRNGYGVNIWPNGLKYSGQWKDNKRNGKGKLIYPDGGRYDGQWEDDMRSGRGKNIWSNGNEYEGEWANNLQNGKGTFTYANGGTYVGGWSWGLRDGYGVNKWTNGDRYEGSWKANQKHGQGTFYHANGSKETGNWKNDALDSPAADKGKTGGGGKPQAGNKNALQVKGLWLNGQPFLVILMPKTSGRCPYLGLAHEYIESLKWDKTFFDHSNDRCYCPNCYKENWNDVIDAGDDKYVIPRGWIRLGLHVDPVAVKVHDIFSKWIVTFHGTTKIAAQSILTHRQFCMPGDKLIDGTQLKIRPGHIPGQNHLYTSPTIAYSSGPAYSPAYDFYSGENDTNYEAQIVLQCRQMPNSYSIGPETIGAKNEICPHIPNSKIEYFTDRRGTIVAYGFLVRFRPKNN